MAQGHAGFAGEMLAHVAHLEEVMARSGYARAAWARQHLNEALRLTERGRCGSLAEARAALRTAACGAVCGGDTCA